MAVAELSVDIKTNASQASRGIGGLTKSLGKFSSGAKSATKHTQGLASSLMKVAKMRILRSIVKAIGSAFSEGLKNAVAFSRSIDGTMAKALDGLSSSALVMKNQLGAALGELLTTLQPILNTIISMITKVANAMSQFFALLGGRSTYLKAGSDAVSKWGDSAKGAGKAAKEWKNQLMGFDEINRLNEPSDSSGGGGSNPAANFGSGSEAELNGVWAEMKALMDEGYFRSAGEVLAQRIQGLIDSFDAKSFGSNLGKKIQNGLSFALGFLQTLDLTSLGQNVVHFFQGIIDEVDGQDVGAFLAQKWVKISEFFGGFITEFAYTGLDEDLGTWLGEIVNGFVDSFDPNVLGEDIKALIDGIVDFTSSFLSTVDFGSLVEAIATGLGSLVGGLASGIWEKLILPAWESLKEWYNDIAEDCKQSGKHIIDGLLEGIWEAIKGVGVWIYEHIFKPFIDGFKTAFGIHSPSTVMADEGGLLIEGLKNGVIQKFVDFKESVKKKWEDFKNFWKGLSLPNFKFKLPHLTVGTRAATGWIADALNFFGLSPNIPTLSVDWYAKGGIVNGASLIGAGEAGREAIVPLENNTEWIDKVAEKVALSITGQGSSDNNVYVYLDGRQISDAVTKHQRMTNRAMGAGYGF